MTERTCPAPRQGDVCGRPAPDGMICHGCGKYLERLLAEIPAWLHQLELAVTRQARVTGRDGGKPTKKFDQPLPFDVPAAELADRVRTELSTAIRGLCESRRAKVPRIARTEDMAVWLVANVEAIRQDEAAVDTLTWARSLRDAIRWQIDNKGRRWAGPCTARVQVLEVGGDGTLSPHVVERECGEDLRTRSGDKVIRCRACGAEYDPIQRARWVLEQSLDHHGSPSFVANALTDAGWPVKAATIRKWAERGKVYAWQDDDLGRPLYRVGDVLDLVTEARQNSA